MAHETLTGRVRHRSERRWGRERLILQVEEKALLTEYVAGQIDSEWKTYWRDAQTSDLAVELLKEKTS